MKATPTTRRLVSLALVAAGVWLSGPAMSQESFQVDLNQDGETIGDMRPVFLQYRSQALPSISPREVARRYQQLFEQSDEPEVRIDALNRLSNLQALANEDLRFSPEQEQAVYRDALGSYDEILARGAFQGRLDELLYQMAKAHAYVGQGRRSIARLEQLVGLYPQSPLVPESRFRIAEAAFSSGDYIEAEEMYQAVLEETAGAEQKPAQSLNDKARYMMGWAQYKQGAYTRSSATFITVLDSQVERTNGFRAIPNSSLEVIDDTFRIMAIMAAKSGGEGALDTLLGEVGDRPYSDLLYDRLADYYASTGNYRKSVAVVDRYVHRNPEHPSVPSMRAQNVDVLQAGGLMEDALRAREAYVSAYHDDLRYQEINIEDRQRWQEYSQLLADHYYHQASQAADPEHARQTFRKAASFYAPLADRSPEPGEVLRLAGDAALQSGDRAAANEFYQRAGYQAGDYAGAADAAWASLTLERQGLASAEALLVDLPGYASDANRFASGFPEDERVAELQADVGSRLVKAGDNDGAVRFAEAAIDNAREQPSIRYSSWLTLGAAKGALGAFGDAEHAWREALVLSNSPAVTVSANEAQALTRQLAISIYRQGEKAATSGDIDMAIAHYKRIDSVAPGSEFAIKGRFDAANTMLQNEYWQQAINELNRFRSDFPDHSLTSQVSEKLVYAYQSSNQQIRAADELTQNGPDNWSTKLRAAELYHLGRDESSRNAIYQSYLAAGLAVTSAEDHVQRQRIRYRLGESGIGGDALRGEIVEIELASSWHSDETLAWAAQAALFLAKEAAGEFESIALTQPLPESLSRKQHALETAKSYFTKVGQLAEGEALSEALYRRAELYRVMARDLMASSRPGGLTALEAEQYEMLLEEQAFPFEELAIELHSENHQQLAQGYFDQWIELSIEALAELHPGRYARDLRWMSWGQEHQEENSDVRS